MASFSNRFLPTRKKKNVSSKVRKERQRQNNNRIIQDNNDNNQNNSTSRTPRTRRKRTRPPRMHAVPSTFLKRKDYIQYFLNYDLTGNHLPAFMRHQINQVKEALKGVHSMQNNLIFQNYCNDQHCTLVDIVKLFYQIFGVSGDVVKEYARLKEKGIDMPKTTINSQVGSIYAECEQDKLQLRPLNEDSDGDSLMAEPKQLTNDELKKQKKEKRQLTRQENVMIDKTKGGHKCFEFSDTSSGFRCCCGNYVVYKRRKKKKRTSAR